MKHVLLKVFVFIGIPTINIFALFITNPLQNNITGILNQDKHYLFVFIWVLCNLGSFYFQINQLKKRLPHSLLLSISLYLAFLGLFIATWIPYQFTHFDLLSELHILFCAIFLCMFLYCYSYLIYQSSLYFNISIQSLSSFIAILFICFMMSLLSGSINTITEIFFCISVSFHLYYLNTHIKNSL